jgi:hypothetical protein
MIFNEPVIMCISWFSGSFKPLIKQQIPIDVEKRRKYFPNVNHVIVRLPNFVGSINIV